MLFIGMTWANAPPVLDYPDVTVEFLADNLDADYDYITVDDFESTQLDQVALPFLGYAVSFPVAVTMKSGTLDVNYVNYTILEATQENRWAANNLFWQCNTTSTNLSHQINLAINQTEYMIVDPSRLDIGEYLPHMLCDN